MSADEIKIDVMETQLSEPSRKRPTAEESEPQATSTPKTAAGKLSEKKRRRSSTVEGTEIEVPSKMRKTSEGESGGKEKDGATAGQ